MKKVAILRYLKSIVWLSVLSLMLGGLSGCAGHSETSAEVHRRHKEVIRNNMLQAQDDADAWLLLDRPSRLAEGVQR